MKVYVVLYQCDSWQGESRFGIFSSPDKAQAAIEAAGMQNFDLTPREVELDSPIQDQF